MIEESISKRITSLRWLCIAAVVLVHAAQWFYFQDPGQKHLAGVDFCYEPVYGWVLDIVLYGVSIGIVPTFFIISGYLHFSKSRKYKDVVVSKTRGLLLPFLIWTALACLAYLALSPLTGTYREFAFLQSREPLKWLSSVFGDYSNFFRAGATPPLLYQFWFIRDLFIMMLVSPLIGWCLRRIPWVYMALCLVPLAFVFVPVVAPNALFCFSLGGLCAIRKWDFFKFVDRWCPWWLVIAGAVASVICMHMLKDNLHVSGNFLTQLPSFLVYLKISRNIVSNDRAFRLSETMAPQSMFMYCAHSLLLINIIGLAGVKIFPVDTSWGIVCCMLFIFVADVVICAAAGMFLRKHSPCVFSLLSEGR